MAKAIAVCQSSTPAAPSPITMPMVADEEWISAVIRAAINAHETTPTMVVESRLEMMSVTTGNLRRGLRPPVIRFRP